MNQHLMPWGRRVEGSVLSLEYWIGVDGGGTGTRVRLERANGDLLGVGEAGPSALGQGIEAAWVQIRLALDRALSQAHLSDRFQLSQAAIGLGLSGVHNVEWRDAFAAQDPGFGLFVLDTDAFTTLLGAHAGQPGAIVAVGTGSVGEVLFADGRRRGVGGWGFPVGDEAGGAWLGVRAMQIAQAAMDGRLPAGALAKAVWSVAGGDYESLLTWSCNAGQAQFAQLAPLVFETEDRDPRASVLISRAVHEIELMAQALDPERQLPFSLCGSIGRRLAPRLTPEWAQRQKPPEGDSSYGAVWLARRQAAQSHDNTSL